MGKQIIIYYSRAGENYFDGKIRRIEKGNTEIAAEIIKELTGADSFRVVQKNPYSDNYSKCTEEAHEDQRIGRRPELIAYPESLDGYDVVYLGYPNYWSTMPMAMFTLLEHSSLKGKTIKPFCTHEGSGMGCSTDDIKKLCPDSIVKEGLAIRGSNAHESRKEIERWIRN